MTVRAKMICTRIHRLHQQKDVESREVHLQPVYEAGEGVNKSWSKWTPSGELRLLITNESAYEQFELGKTYYVDIERCPEEA